MFRSPMAQAELSISKKRIKDLPLEQLEVLGDDLLDFTQLGDLLAWLECYE
jgi:Domain of unknown function (DUF4351)